MPKIQSPLKEKTDFKTNWEITDRIRNIKAKSERKTTLLINEGIIITGSEHGWFN